MRINWKVRLKNPTFWITAVPALVTLIYAVLALFDVVPSITKETVLDAFAAIMAALSTLGVIVDPTTKGVSDSDRALKYERPSGGEQGAGTMTFAEFLKEYSGKAVDYDGTAGAQCVDLIKLYLKNVFGITPKAIGNAHAYFDNFALHSFLNKNFVKIKNTKEFVPLKGDICVWSKSLNGYGHIAIATGEGNTLTFESFDMNWNGKSAKFILHDYKHFLGVLRPINRENIDGATLYKVVKAVNVREGAGTSYRRKMYDEFTPYDREQVILNGGKPADNDFPKGMILTVTQKKGTFGKADSGWVSLNLCEKLGG